MDRTKMQMQNQEAALKSLENQVRQISQVLNTRPMGGFSSDTKVAKGATPEKYKAISTRSGKMLITPNKSKHGEEIVFNPSAVIVPDIPALAGKDHKIPLEPEKAYPVTTTTPHIKLPRSNTLEEIKPPLPFP
ncbi:hypothetical protein V6N13_123889 [Hibiscus sabdariffa]